MKRRHEGLLAWLKKATDEQVEKTGTTRAYLKQIAYGHKLASPEIAVRVELTTNRVATRKELRTADWSILWPELRFPNSQSSPDSENQQRPARRERIYRDGDHAKERRAHLINKTLELAKMADERGLEAQNDPTAAREEANYRVTYHTLSAELLAIASPSDAEEAKTQRENRQEHLKHADRWQRRLIELGGAA